ncbi:TetR/AcrR family transcriptional regulator [Streptomyces cylindrosporus]|uniref:TetR/AcrR family transcriptional regulator n=1 Tax=Streptomyces cylindrosporus TaxID=2927583 RepID=A0ABS9Y0C9_9ACTN|nr:TetR/AcrR family transcriptional regulator [Streptomyces cylindrosporus]MCI3270668.1 TetR/AcrR family transcriptional regulator [Streptomyces cylindrosporus]
MTNSTPRIGRPPADLAPATLDEILGAALQMFADKGYDGASVAALNRQLGVSHNLIHQRFGSKEKLWFAAVDRAFGAIAAELRSELEDTSGGPWEQFRRVIVRFVRVNARRPEVLRLLTVEGVAETPRLQYLYERHVDPLLAATTAPMRRLMGEGAIAPVSLRTLYFLIAHGASAPYGLIGLARRIGPGDPQDPQAVTDHANLVADLILDGLRNR